MGMLEEFDSSRIQEVAAMGGEFPSHIPVLEDKYSVEENLAQLGQQQQEEDMDIQELQQQQHSQRAEVCGICNKQGGHFSGSCTTDHGQSLLVNQL